MTTESTGSIGVSPAMTRKVAVAESSAMPTATAPINREATGMGADEPVSGMGTGIGAVVGLSGATWSTVVIKSLAGVSNR